MAARALTQPWGIDLFCFGRKFLVYNLVSRNLKIKFRRSFLGLFWTLLGPFLSAMIYYYVFKVIIRVQTPHYIVYILSGILPWTFFASTSVEGLDGIVGNHSLITKVPIPLHIFAYVGSLTNLVTLLFAFPIILGVAALDHVALGLNCFLIVPWLCVLFLQTYGIAILLSVAFVYLRDLKHAINFLLQILLYATPIFYDISMVPAYLKWTLFFNPIGLSVTGIRDAILSNQSAEDSLKHFAAATVWALILLMLGSYVLGRRGRNIAERI